MTKLINLIMSDGLHRKLFFNEVKVCLGSYDCCNTASREAYL